MRDVATTRRENFRRLVKGLQGSREASIKLDMSESQISQLISETRRKDMGPKLARTIERKAALPQGSLDMPITSSGRPIINVPVFDQPELESLSRAEAIHDAISARLKSGFSDPHEPFVIWDHSNPSKPTGDLFAVYAFDESMAPIISEGDLVIFDSHRSMRVRPRPGSIVCAAPENAPVTIRMIRESDNGKYELLAKSPLFAPITIESGSAILGTMIETRWQKPKAM